MPFCIFKKKNLDLTWISPPNVNKKRGVEKQVRCINFRSDVQQYNVEEWLFWVLFLEFLLFVEFMEPGQLSISLYSVCKISDLNTEPVSVGFVLFFFF